MGFSNLLAWLDLRLVGVAGAQLTLGETAGFLTGVLCVWLLARQNIWNWPLAIANVLLYLVIFFRAGLYADAALQVVFAALNTYGWWSWLRGGPGVRHNLPVARTPAATWRWLLAAAALATAAIVLLLDRATDSTVPFWDASTTALSLMAIYGQARKFLESWLLWIVADLIYIPLYLYKGLWLTAGLYLVYLTLCIFGLVAWRRDLQRSPRSQHTVVATP